MEIKGDDFVFTSLGDIPLFDVDILRTVNKGKESERTELKNCAYGVPLDHAIKYVISSRIANKYDTTDLKTYLEEYKDQLKQLKELCQL